MHFCNLRNFSANQKVHTYMKSNKPKTICTNI